VIFLYGQRGVEVIGQYPDRPAIAAFGRTLPPKVAQLQRALKDKHDLELAQRDLVQQSAAQTAELYATTLMWRARVQVELGDLDAEDMAITETQMADVVLANARFLIDVLEGRGAEGSDAAAARVELESKYSGTKAAHEAVRNGRVAMQDTQGELRALGTDVHKELVKLRKVVRAALGPKHVHAQYLRIDRRAAAEPSVETSTEAEPTNQ
jgi:hypothetical protein